LGSRKIYVAGLSNFTLVQPVSKLLIKGTVLNHNTVNGVLKTSRTLRTLTLPSRAVTNLMADNHDNRCELVTLPHLKNVTKHLVHLV
jgi:hypothetical protein